MATTTPTAPTLPADKPVDETKSGTLDFKMPIRRYWGTGALNVPTPRGDLKALPNDHIVDAVIERDALPGEKTYDVDPAKNGKTEETFTLVLPIEFAKAAGIDVPDDVLNAEKIAAQRKDAGLPPLSDEEMAEAVAKMNPPPPEAGSSGSTTPSSPISPSGTSPTPTSSSSSSVSGPAI